MGQVGGGCQTWARACRVGWMGRAGTAHLLAVLQLDGGLLKTPTCPTAVVRRSAASMAGSTPKTKQLADSGHGSGRKLDESWGRRVSCHPRLSGAAAYPATLGFPGQGEIR